MEGQGLVGLSASATVVRWRKTLSTFSTTRGLPRNLQHFASRTADRSVILEVGLARHAGPSRAPGKRLVPRIDVAI